MSEARRRSLVATALATVGLAVALDLRPVSTDRIVAGYVLALAAVALAALTRELREREELRRASVFDAALVRRREERVRPPELVRLEREITLGGSNAGHLHARLLPLLREAAAARLAAHHDVELTRRPAAACALLGDEAWELLRPDRPEPEDLSAPGLALRDLRRLLDTLERV